jgi:hypothetical protein
LHFTSLNQDYPGLINQMALHRHVGVEVSPRMEVVDADAINFRR